MKNLKVVNDIAERAIKLMSDYNNILTNDEQRQYILQVVKEYRRIFPTADKASLVTDLRANIVNNMKLIFACLLTLAVAKAEPAVYAQSLQNNDPDVIIQQVEVIEVPWQGDADTPQQEYGPPQQEYGPPQQEYGPPKQEYGPPKQEYGPPQQEYGTPQQEYGPPKPVYGPPKPVYGPPPELTTTTEADLSTTTEYPTTTEIPDNSTAVNNTRSGKLEKEDLTEKGAYYIYHPNGVLQRVVYATKDDAKNMVYSAQLRYQNVEPINGPIYTYDPVTYDFQRINK
ncbi:hypothetical protein NQ318_021443 [Aromia moschata]|uniref:Uncharacterized protein n=1 Tax=Aromia moschata TaxID=1265417 RepID=A0AAV8ZC87_9CUCU|nr:hypothetical protein NQ318_021443 [Aromia moschata]